MLIGPTIIIIIAVTTVPNAIHLIEALWMMVVILAAFFTLGRAWGISFLLVNAGLYTYYFIFQFNETLVDRIVHSQKHSMMMSIEFTFAMFLIGYIMYQFAIVNDYARKKSEVAFEQLEQQKIKVEQQNEEKTVLLQEIHHRVKNNLQVIISLLRLQSNELKSKETVDSFNEAISRILTMSLVHQKMYEKESLVDINIGDYLQTLLDDLIATNSTQDNIKCYIESSIESVSAETIVPVGLIINELVSNSLKHAFEDAGKISLKIQGSTDHRFKLIYHDNGTWKEPINSDSFGLQLIEVFTQQLEGTYSREVNDTGTTYFFEFANKEE